MTLVSIWLVRYIAGLDKDLTGEEQFDIPMRKPEVAQESERAPIPTDGGMDLKGIAEKLGGDYGKGKSFDWSGGIQSAIDTFSRNQNIMKKGQVSGFSG